jgi:tyrosine-specific transport protein
MHQKTNLLGGSLLVAGTSIGGGMLALPVLTSLAGFIPSLFIYLICWLFMASTGLLFLEVAHWMKGDSNIVSMANYTLGKTGRYFAWTLYLFLFYCLTIAYIVGCGNIVSEISQFTIPDWLGPIIFAILFAPLILIPTSLAGKINVFLVAGLGISYCAFVVMGFGYVKPELLARADWSKSLMVLPIAFTSFAYQGIIPTLISYMHGNIASTRRAILIGSFIPLIAYAIWEWLILGIVPTYGPGGLAEALQKGDNAVYPLRTFIQNPSVYYIGQSFAFFALITSFLGVTLGLRDFLADGLKIKKDWQGKMWLTFLTLAFPLVIAVVYPHIFLTALDYAGGFGCALLLGLLPVLMVWKGRYDLGLNAQHQLPGGRLVLAILGLFVVFEVLNELKNVIAKF